MKRAFQLGSLFAATLCLGLSSLTAQEAKTRAKANTDASARQRAGQLDSKTQGSSIRASKLMGMNIQNAKGEDVGEVSDIVIEADTGRVQYAAVTYGGFLGVGNKMFAVPFAAFQVQQKPDNRDEHFLVLDVSQKQLEGAQGFDEDSWPNFADRKFAQELNKRYGVQRRAGRPTYGDRQTPANKLIERQQKERERSRDRDIDVDIDKDGVDVDVDPDLKRDN